jgi:hypothetical protein
MTSTPNAIPDETNKAFKKYFLRLRRDKYIRFPQLLRDQNFEGSDKLRSPSEPIGPVRRNSQTPDMRFVPEAALN